MVWCVDKYGLAEDLSKVPARELEGRFPDGRGLYATLAGLAHDASLPLTAFAAPLKAEPYFDGADALEAQERGIAIADLDPVSIEADYRVEYFDGQLETRPLSQAEAQERGYAKMLDETGERIWHIVAIDSAELTIFYAGSTKKEALNGAWGAVRRLHPEARSLHSALRDEPGLSVTQGTVRAAEIPNNAALLRAEDGSAKFFGAEDEHELQGEVLGVLSQMTDAEGDMFDLAEAAGLRIEVGYLWLSDGLVDEAIRQRRAREEGPQP